MSQLKKNVSICTKSETKLYAKTVKRNYFFFLAKEEKKNQVKKQETCEIVGVVGTLYALSHVISYSDLRGLTLVKFCPTPFITAGQKNKTKKKKQRQDWNRQ